MGSFVFLRKMNKIHLIMYIHKVALISFGDISTQKISRILNILEINHKILLPQERPDFIPTHVILSGNNNITYGENMIPEWIIMSKIPVLGIGFGMELIVKTFGGCVKKMEKKEYGPTEVTEIINGMQRTKITWMDHSAKIIGLPEIFTVTGVTNNNDIASFTDNLKWWGIRYHPESSRYKHNDIFLNFLNMKEEGYTRENMPPPNLT